MREYLLYCLVYVHITSRSQLIFSLSTHRYDMTTEDYANYRTLLAQTILKWLYGAYIL